MPKTEAASGTLSRGSAANASKNVAVVGGSAAGLLTASVLARQGVGVRVFERIETLEPAERTLIVTNRMRALLGRAAEGSIVNEIRRFELFTDGRSATFELKQPDLIIERRALIQGLAEEARRAGAGLELGRRFQALHSNGRGLVLEVERCTDGSSEEIHADTIIGGDGAASRVARAAGWAPLDTVPLVQAIVPLPKDMAPDTARVWFVPQDTPYFYWLIPESPQRGVLGLIGIDGQRTRSSLQRFMEKRHFQPQGFQGARIPVYQGWVPIERKIAHGRVYLVGDAAAQVKVTTFGGVVTGFRGALGVSERILTRGFSPELRALRRELDLHMLIRRSIHGFRQADYSRLVDWMNDGMRRSLSRVSRDQAARVLWHVCRNQPRLLWMGLRGLLLRAPDSPEAEDSSVAPVRPAPFCYPKVKE